MNVVPTATKAISTAFLLMISICLFSQTQNGELKMEWTKEYNHKDERKIIPKKHGLEYTKAFVSIQSIQSIHLIQFAVYPIDVNPKDLFAPENVGQVWLIKHPNTTILNHPKSKGAYYIVQPCASPKEARRKVVLYKRKGIDCWYNEKLAETPFSIIGLSDSFLD